MRSWLSIMCLIGVLLAGCVVPGWRDELPKPHMASLDTLGYAHTTTEADRHLFYLSAVEPRLVEHWAAFAFPFGRIRVTCWQGEERFCTQTWFPRGLPAWKEPGGQSEHCGLQTYQGVKLEPNLSREIQSNGHPFWVLEYHPVEQRAFRWICTLDPTGPGYPQRDNMAGY